MQFSMKKIFATLLMSIVCMCASAQLKMHVSPFYGAGVSSISGDEDSNYKTAFSEHIGCALDFYTGNGGWFLRAEASIGDKAVKMKNVSAEAKKVYPKGENKGITPDLNGLPENLRSRDITINKTFHRWTGELAFMVGIDGKLSETDENMRMAVMAGPFVSYGFAGSKVSGLCDFKEKFTYAENAGEENRTDIPCDRIRYGYEEGIYDTVKRWDAGLKIAVKLNLHGISFGPEFAFSFTKADGNNRTRAAYMNVGYTF